MNPRFVFIADTHHFSRTLSDGGEAYAYRSGSDQKCLEETGAIIDAAFEKILEDPPAAVMIAGDLSDDGERICHEEFREKLRELQKHVPVYVITATHDWCCDENPRRFTGGEVTNDVETVPHEELSEFYREFGLDRAISSYKTHLGIYSYVAQIADGVRLLALNDDQNGKGRAGYTPDHMAWVEEQIRKAKEDGQLMIGMEHHLLIAHIHPFITSGHCVGDREEVAAKLADAGLRYMFVGHSHIQRIDTFVSPSGNPITEVNIGSLCGYPAPIVNVTVTDDSRLHIVTEHLESFEGADDAQEFLKAHAVQMIDLPLKGILVSREEFGKRLDALGANGKKLSAAARIRCDELLQKSKPTDLRQNSPQRGRRGARGHESYRHCSQCPALVPRRRHEQSRQGQRILPPRHRDDINPLADNEKQLAVQKAKRVRRRDTHGQRPRPRGRNNIKNTGLP